MKKFNPRDISEKFVRTLTGNAELWKVINAGGCPMYIIVKNGMEVASCNTDRLDGMLEWFESAEGQSYTDFNLKSLLSEV